MCNHVWLLQLLCMCSKSCWGGCTGFFSELRMCITRSVYVSSVHYACNLRPQMDGLACYVVTTRHTSSVTLMYF